MVTSDFRLEVKIRPFRTHAMKNIKYNHYLWPNCQNFCVLKEIGVEKHMMTSDLTVGVEI